MNEIGTDCASQSSNLDSEQWSGQRRLVKRVLFIVEIAAVAGLLLSATWLWQLREQLKGELEVAQQIEAALQASEQLSDGEQSSRAVDISCAITDTSALTESQRPCRLEVPALGLDAVLLAGGAQGNVFYGQAIEAENPVFVISREIFSRIIKKPEQLQGGTIRLVSGNAMVDVEIAKASLIRADARQAGAEATEYLSLTPHLGQNTADDIEHIIIVPDYESDRGEQWENGNSQGRMR